MSFTIRFAKEDDIPTILQSIFSQQVQKLNIVVATEAYFQKHYFRTPQAETLLHFKIATRCFAILFRIITFLGRAGFTLKIIHLGGTRSRVRKSTPNHMQTIAKERGPEGSRECTQLEHSCNFLYESSQTSWMDDLSNDLNNRVQALGMIPILKGRLIKGHPPRSAECSN